MTNKAEAIIERIRKGESRWAISKAERVAESVVQRVANLNQLTIQRGKTGRIPDTLRLRYLLALAPHYPTHQAIANAVGCTKQMISSDLKKARELFPVETPSEEESDQ